MKVGNCPKCGAPQGMIGWLCGCWYRHPPLPKWMIDDYNKGIRWFRQNNPEAYMALLD